MKNTELIKFESMDRYILKIMAIEFYQNIHFTFQQDGIFSFNILILR